MSSKLVKESLSLLSDGSASSSSQKRSSNVKSKSNGKGKLAISKNRNNSSKNGIRKERERQKQRCATGNLERAIYLHRTTDPLDVIRNEDTEQQQRLKENLAYLKKNSLVSVKETRLRQRILARLNEEAAAKQKERQRNRQFKQQREADASDEEWASLDV